MNVVEQLDAHGRKILRVKQSPEELRKELMRLQEKHARWLAKRQTVQSLMEQDKEQEP
jgi:hypothetical protein